MSLQESLFDHQGTYEKNSKPNKRSSPKKNGEIFTKNKQELPLSQTQMPYISNKMNVHFKILPKSP